MLEPVWSCVPIMATSLVDLRVTCDGGVEAEEGRRGMRRMRGSGGAGGLVLGF